MTVSVKAHTYGVALSSACCCGCCCGACCCSMAATAVLNRRTITAHVMSTAELVSSLQLLDVKSTKKLNSRVTPHPYHPCCSPALALMLPGAFDGLLLGPAVPTLAAATARRIAHNKGPGCTATTVSNAWLTCCTWLPAPPPLPGRGAGL